MGIAGSLFCGTTARYSQRVQNYVNAFIPWSAVLRHDASQLLSQAARGNDLGSTGTVPRFPRQRGSRIVQGSTSASILPWPAAVEPCRSFQCGSTDNSESNKRVLPAGSYQSIPLARTTMTGSTPPSWFHPLVGADPKTLRWALSSHGPVAKRRRAAVWATRFGAAYRRPFMALEKARVARRLAKAPPMPAPVFIVGHWRSGTTHLYNVLSRSAAFGWVPPFAAGLPWDFLGIVGPIRYDPGKPSAARPADRQYPGDTGQPAGRRTAAGPDVHRLLLPRPVLPQPVRGITSIGASSSTAARRKRLRTGGTRSPISSARWR